MKIKPIIFLLALVPGSFALIPNIIYSANSANEVLETKFSLHKESINNSQFNVTLKSNDIPCQYGSSSYLHQSILTPSSKKIGYNFADKAVDDLYLAKRGENYYRVYLNSSKAKSGDIYTFSGEYTSPYGLKVNVLTSQFKYDGANFITYEPEISIKNTDNIIAEDNVIYVNTGTSKDELVATISNEFSGTISYSYPDGSLSNNKFVSYNGTSTFDKFYVYCESNGYTFRYDFKLVVGYKDFIMNKGAALALDNSSSLKFKANISENIISKAEEIGFLAVKKDDLKNNEFSEKTLFKNNTLFSFNKNETNKIRVEKRYAVGVNNFNGTYTFSGIIDNISKSDYLTSYLASFYIKTEYGYFFASNFDYKSSSFIRSVVGVAARAINANDTNSEALKSKYLGDDNTINYSVRYYSKENATLLKEDKLVGKINEEVTITCDEIVIGGTTYKSVGQKSITKNLVDNEVCFEFYLSSLDNGINIYAYGTPYLSPKNNYDNDFNKGISSDLKKYGFTGVVYYGQTICTEDNVDALKDIISMFYKNGLTTIIMDRSSTSNNKHFYDGVPDFSDCNGFDGLLSWDEPNNDEAFATIKDMSKSYNSIYANKDDSKFLTTLLPSYGFETYDQFITYVENYYKNMNETLLDDELKSLCVDYYPFTYANNATSLRDGYIKDLLYLRSLASQTNATPFLIMQLSSVYQFERASYYSEMLLQTYMALSFGYRNIMWYRTFSTDENSLFIEGNTYDSDYNLKYSVTTSPSLDVLHINKEIFQKAELLKNYEYVGTYLSSTSGNYNLNSYSSYMSDRLTSLPSELKITSSNQYHVGVYKDNEGKYAYVISSYINNDSKYSLTLNVSKALTAYQGSDIKTLEISKQYSYNDLVQGESIILI